MVCRRCGESKGGGRASTRETLKRGGGVSGGANVSDTHSPTHNKVVDGVWRDS